MKLSEYPYPGVQKPFAHQIATVHFCLRHPRGFILNGMGTGKTMSVLWATDILFVHNKISKVLIVAPLSILEAVWGNEIKNRMPHRTYRILIGTTQQRMHLLSSKAHYYIINHDAVRIDKMEKALIDAKFDVCIIDELTAFKNATSKRSKALRNITKKCKAVWGLTGSPTANSPIDAFGQAKLVNPENITPYFTRFRDAVMTQLDPYTYIPKNGWENIVKKALSPGIRYAIEDCIDLPPVIEQDRYVEMSKEQKKMYDEMRKHFMTEYENGLITASNAGVKALKLLQISAGCVYDDQKFLHHIDCGPKLQELLDIFWENGGDKILVFSAFRGSVALVTNFLRSKGISCESIDGDTDPKSERPRIYREFQEGNLKAISAQASTVSYGLNLTASRLMVWFTPVPSNLVFMQANARVRRPGQTRTQIQVHMSCSAAERRVYSALRNKEKMGQALLELFKR